MCVPQIAHKGIPSGDDLGVIYRKMPKSKNVTKRNTFFKIRKWLLRELLECLRTKQFVLLLMYAQLGPDTHHLNALIFDSKHKLITRFEPHGAYRANNFLFAPINDFVTNWFNIGYPHINAAITEWLNSAQVQKLFSGYRYRAPIDYCPKLGPQWIEATIGPEMGEKYAGGYCAAWSLMFLHLRLLNPNASDETIVEAMVSTKNAQNLRKMIRNYAGFIAEMGKALTVNMEKPRWYPQVQHSNLERRIRDTKKTR